MESISQLVKFAESQSRYQKRKSAETADKNPKASAKHAKSAQNMADIAEVLTSRIAPEPDSEEDIESLFSLNPLNLQGIPEDLESELSVSQSDVEDAQILELLRIANRSLDLNELLMGCYRKYGVKHKRNMLTARIYRLIKRNAVHATGKGEYALGRGPDLLDQVDQYNSSEVVENAT